MSKYENLLEYINYFKNSNNQFYKIPETKKSPDGAILMQGPRYDDEFEEFTKLVYQSDLMKRDYLDCIEKRCKGEREINKFIDDADIELLSAILTCVMRQERFCDGAWAGAIKDGTFLKILSRLKELSE